MSAHNFYPMNKQTEIKIIGTPSGFITCGLPQGGAAVSDTPKTDGAVFVVFSSPSNDVEAVDADFARELERENAALRELAERMATEMREVDHEFASLRDYDAARKEAQP